MNFDYRAYCVKLQRRWLTRIVVGAVDFYKRQDCLLLAALQLVSSSLPQNSVADLYVLELWRNLLTSRSMAVAGDRSRVLVYKLSTVDCLEADRLEFHYRITAHV